MGDLEAQLLAIALPEEVAAAASDALDGPVAPAAPGLSPGPIADDGERGPACAAASVPGQPVLPGLVAAEEASSAMRLTTVPAVSLPSDTPAAVREALAAPPPKEHQASPEPTPEPALAPKSPTSVPPTVPPPPPDGLSASAAATFDAIAAMGVPAAQPSAPQPGAGAAQTDAEMPPPAAESEPSPAAASTEDGLTWADVAPVPVPTKPAGTTAARSGAPAALDGAQPGDGTKLVEPRIVAPPTMRLVASPAASAAAAPGDVASRLSASAPEDMVLLHPGWIKTATPSPEPDEPVTRGAEGPASPASVWAEAASDNERALADIIDPFAELGCSDGNPLGPPGNPFTFSAVVTDNPAAESSAAGSEPSFTLSSSAMSSSQSRSGRSPPRSPGDGGGRTALPTDVVQSDGAKVSSSRFGLHRFKLRLSEAAAKGRNLADQLTSNPYATISQGLGLASSSPDAADLAAAGGADDDVEDSFDMIGADEANEDGVALDFEETDMLTLLTTISELRPEIAFDSQDRRCGDTGLLFSFSSFSGFFFGCSAVSFSVCTCEHRWLHAKMYATRCGALFGGRRRHSVPDAVSSWLGD